MSLKSKDKFFYVITVDGSTRSDEARQESVRCSDGPIITSDQKVLWFSSFVGKSISPGEIAVNLETVKFR